MFLINREKIFKDFRNLRECADTFGVPTSYITQLAAKKSNSFLSEKNKMYEFFKKMEAKGYVEQIFEERK